VELKQAERWQVVGACIIPTSVRSRLGMPIAIEIGTYENHCH